MSQYPQNYPPPQSNYPQQGYAPVAPMQPVPGGSEKHPTYSNVQSRPVKHGHFQNGFCSCCDPCGTCCLGFWCPCILFGKTRTRLHNPAMTREQLPCCTGGCVGYAAICFLCPGFQCIFGCLQRGDVRARYGIDSNACVDCLAHSFCDCCVCFPLSLRNYLFFYRVRMACWFPF